MISRFINATINVVLASKEYFVSLRHERGIWWAVSYLFVFSAIFVMVSFFSQLDYYLQYVSDISGLGPVFISELFSNWWFLGIVLLFSLLGMITVSLFRYSVIHFFVRLFEKNAQLENTIKALSYTVVPGYVAAVLLMLYILALPLERLWLLVCILISFFIVEGYSVYIRCRAISGVHQISLLKALISLYLLGFVAANLLLGSILAFLIFLINFI